MLHYWSFWREDDAVPEPLPFEITPHDLQRRQAAGERVRLVDVREPWEYQTARLEGAELIPMGDVPAALPQLEGMEEPLVVYCHHGVRSLRVAAWLRNQGLEEVQSLAGGIDRWSLEIDPAVPRYT
jgi:rhodanese-related sulfurtransferase